MLSPNTLSSKIINEVKKSGDIAVKKFTKKYDAIELDKIEVTRSEIKSAYKNISRKTLKSLIFAYRNIKKFSEAQYKQIRDFEIETNPGVFLGQRSIPIERVGVYVPAGTYPLPSTALMACIPAKVAGVKKIVLCSPPTCNGSINPMILVAADICGVDRIFRIGGIQAIAAMAYGTETIPRVDKIVGPGNKYVTEAKRQVFGDVGIDVLAGPSEILIIADESAKPDYIVSELLAQKEHGKGSKAILVTDSKKIAEVVRKKVGSECRIVVTKTTKESVDIANEFAPEHLSLQVRNPRYYLPRLKNYGCLFLGKYSSVVLGDYVSGTNHILPTSGASRYSEGVSVKVFIKQQTYQYITKKGLNYLADAAEELSEKEGLQYHKKSIQIRR